MTKQEELEMAQDQLAMACENLANQKSHESNSFKLATEEVEACIHALKNIQQRSLKESFKSWKIELEKQGQGHGQGQGQGQGQ